MSRAPHRLGREYTAMLNVDFQNGVISEGTVTMEGTATDTSDIIDVSAVKANRQLAAGLIAPADEDTTKELAPEHASMPIKSMDEIYAISNWYLDRKRYRDNMLFVCGINFGLRVSDLLTLRFCDLIDDKMVFRTTFPIFEKKTRNTRKVKKNRYVSINDAVIDAVTLYLENTPGVKLSDYMFRCAGNRCTENKPMHRNSVERILKEAGTALGLPYHIATHTLRKTFGYHQMVMSGNDTRKLLLLQKIFGHSSTAQTLQYIGITSEEIEDAYMKLNLCSRSGGPTLIDSSIHEDDSPATMHPAV